jgi:transglutaminase/protease-like cytokinesis protein 3
MIRNLFTFLIIFVSINLQAQLTDFDTINFNKADSIANSFKGENLRSLPILSYNLTNSLSTDVEKFRAIYIWVCSNIENDFKAFLKNDKERRKYRNDSIKLEKWNKEFSKQSFKKLVKEQKTVCTGYAYLIKELSNYANINCEIINGYGRTTYETKEDYYMSNHSWNAVQLNDKWYLCDATWSTGVFDLDKYYFEYNYNNGYFLTEPDMFVKNHYPLEVKWLLIEDYKLETFFNAPLIYGEAFRHGIKPVKPTEMDSEVIQNDTITILLKELLEIDSNKFNIELISRNYTKSIIPIINRKDNDCIELKFSIPYKGLYDVHLKLGNDYLSTYLIKVKKEKK